MNEMYLVEAEQEELREVKHQFLLLNFVLAVLYLGVFQPNQFLIQDITIGAFLVIVVIGTIIDYTNRN